MNFFGLLAFLIVMMYSSYPSKLKKLESKIKKLEKKMRGEKSMSKILAGLINTRCTLVCDIGLEIAGKREFQCTVLEVDDDWIKFDFIDKKGVNKIQIIRIENVDRVDSIETEYLRNLEK